MPLRGKILNVERARLDKMLANNEVKALIIALGTAIGEQLDVSRLRYNRIIIMTDADVDGAHIRTLLLTLFYRHFKQVVENGNIYIAQPPLYKISWNKEKFYAFSDEERDSILEEIQEKIAAAPKKSKGEHSVAKAMEGEISEAEISEEITQVEVGKTILKGVSIQRYKGLGEMNPDQLWETTMNPENRVLLKVTVDDAEKADELFDILMGDMVPPRKKFIQTHAKKVKNLDI